MDQMALVPLEEYPMIAAYIQQSLALREEGLENQPALPVAAEVLLSPLTVVDHEDLNDLVAS